MSLAWQLMESGSMIRCRNGHIVGSVEDGRLVMRYRKRTAIYSSERGDAESDGQDASTRRSSLFGGMK